MENLRAVSAKIGRNAARGANDKRKRPATIEIRPWWQFFVAAVILTCTYSGFGLLEQWTWRILHSLSPQLVWLAVLLLIVLNYAIFARPSLIRVAEFVLLNSEDPPKGTRQNTKPWLVIGFGFLCSMLFLLERVQPMYFTRDDNTAQFLPMMVYAGRSMMHKMFPEWNPYQFMGVPSANLGIYAFTYPVTYVSYFFATLVLRNELLTIDTFVIFHLMGGFFAMFWLGRCYGLRPSLAALSGLCSALSGFALIASRNWYYMSPVFLYLPLVMGAMEKLRNSQNRKKWAVFLGCVLGVFFHAGNAQLWTYTGLFLLLAFAYLMVSRSIGWRETVSLLGAGLIALGIAFPLFLVQIQATRGVVRPMPENTGNVLPASAAALFVPGSWWGVTSASDWGPGADLLHGSEILYSGSLFTLATCVPILLLLIYRYRHRIVHDNLWAICAVLAWILALGTKSILWSFLLELPGFDRFRVPFKFLAMFVVFSTLAGAVVLERISGKLSVKLWFEIAVFAGVLGMLVIHCNLARTCFYRYTSMYEPLDPSIATYLKPKDGSPARFLPFLPIRSVESDYRKGLPLDLPTLAEVYSAAGLDGLVDWDPYQLQAASLMRNIPWRSLQEYGIRYVLVHRLADQAIHAAPGRLAGIERVLTADVSVEKAVRSLGRPVFHDASVELFEVQGARPLAFCQARSLPVRFDAAGAAVETAAAPDCRELVLNVLWRPGYYADADGKPAGIQRDLWGRISVHLQAPTKTLQIHFRPPWRRGVVSGLVLVLLGLLIAAAGASTPAGVSDQNRSGLSLQHNASS